jgi:hypothetical protein
VTGLVLFLGPERREIAAARQRAPVVAAAIQYGFLVLACLAPLGLAGYLIYVMRHSSADDDTVTQLLIEELVAEWPRLLLGGPAGTEQAALPAMEHEPGAAPDDEYPF